jgi:predicted transposase YbfD/YdcC
MNTITAGVREREDANRAREAGHLDEIQGVVANALNLFRNALRKNASEIVSLP